MTHLNDKQRDALKVLQARKANPKPSEWVWPKSVCRSAATFKALEARGLAESRINEYGASEYRLVEE